MTWTKIVEVPSLKSAQAEARRWRKRADRVKVVREKSGWYGVYAEGISEGAKIIFGLNPQRGGATMARRRRRKVKVLGLPIVPLIVIGGLVWWLARKK